MRLNWKVIRKPGYIGYVLYDGTKKKGLVERRSFGNFTGWVLSPDEEVEQGIMKVAVAAPDVRSCKLRLEEYVIKQLQDGAGGAVKDRDINEDDCPF